MYEKIVKLLQKRGMSIYALSKATGIGNSSFSDLKMGRVKTLSSQKLKILSDYFGVSIDYFLAEEGDEKKRSEPVEEDDVKVALFGGKDNVTEEMWDEVLDYIEFIKIREAKKNPPKEDGNK